MNAEQAGAIHDDEDDNVLAENDDASLRSADPVERKLAAARKDLLDMSLRNKMLSYRETRATSLRIHNRDSGSIWESLYEEGEALSFLATPKPAPADSPNNDDPGDLGEDLGGVFEEAVDTESVQGRALATRLDSEALFRRLLRISSTAHTLLEEQGVNSLFLALGFLVWFESDAADTPRQAPLVLLPVQLVRTRRGESFSLEYDGNDVTENLSLREKLRLEFGVELPDFPFEGDSDRPARLDDYFADVASAISMQPRWSVDAEAVHLGFYSFTRFLMYKDLDPKSWPEDESPSLHPVLRKLLSPGGGFAADPSSDIDFDAFDEEFDVTTSGFVMDADGSQARAVLEVAAGANLVIQGPPGTGKSQTITNVIGNALAQGKRVLFVAEKLAALNVVKKRLDEAGIGSAALELHSSRATKAGVIAEIERTLAGARLVGGAVPPSPAAELARTKSTLNAYEKVVNQRRGPTASTFVDALGQQLALEAKVGAEYEFEDDSLVGMSRDDHDLALQALAEADQAISSLGDPSRSVFRHTALEAAPVFFEDVVPRKVDEVLGALTRLDERGTGLTAMLALEWDGRWGTVEPLARTAKLLARRPDLAGLNLDRRVWEARPEELAESFKTGLVGAEVREGRTGQLNEFAWSVRDAMSHVQNLRDGQRSWFARLGRRYQGSRRWAQALYRDAPPKDAQSLADLAQDILRAQECDEVIRQKGDLLSAALRGDLPRTAQAWRQAERACEYLLAFFEAVRSGTLVPGVESSLAIDFDANKLSSDAIDLIAADTEARRLLADLWAFLGLTEADQIAETPEIRQTAHLAERVSMELASLRFAPRLTKAANALRALGLTRYADTLWDWEPKPYSADDVFRRAYYRALTTQTFESNWGLLSDLDSDAHDRIAEQFRALDKKSWQEHSRRELAAALREQIPAQSGVGEMRVIAREIAKKKRHLPIRKLLEQAGPALQLIKPVFMMSPLSIAQFLPRGAIHFDLVVFDEASQVRVADALGAIVRGRQVVVVGDTKQMPPTNFFNKMVESDDEDSETADIESVLSMFQLAGAREASLQWHYRSKDPTLISVSNQEFYNRSLILFPSTQHGSDKATGLHFHHDPTALYERGRTQTNPQEAETVAAAVITHARENAQAASPKSLGVVALSLKQREAIEFAVERQRRLNPDVESFFAGGKLDSFFIKNLESVQGDERDVIFISVGYGRWEGGRVAQEFGPINRDGGEKRLNVLITRAKERIDVFSNFRGGDLQLASGASKGLTVLKRFLAYAETGELETFGETGRATDSPFEDQVRSAVEGLGYDVEPQVGEAGYFIDLAVRHPEQPGKYVLAIECDGAAYHSSLWARDRDRLRQEVLESLGWRFHRVWSTDWFRDASRKREIEKIRLAIESAIDVNAAKQSGSQLSAVSTATESSAFEEQPVPVLVMAEVPAPVAQAYVVKDIARSSDYLDLHEVQYQPLLERTVEVLAVETPMHFDQLVSRFKEAWGMGRAGDRSRNHLRRMAQFGYKAGRFVLDGDFLYLDESRSATVRDRGGLATAERRIEYVAPEELDAAIKQVVRDGVSASEDEICVHVTRLLGFARTTQDMRDVLVRRIRALSNDAVLTKIGDRYSFPR
ncbi:MAG: DUF3320 domain-containing protein [Microbacterium sp.]|nr:DUF3320 domain-containing protein [Microbacterium sp.]MBA4345695.1 DUF3320 domain-containing protein [Microbacterium sp.]